MRGPPAPPAPPCALSLPKPPHGHPVHPCTTRTASSLGGVRLPRDASAQKGAIGLATGSPALMDAALRAAIASSTYHGLHENAVFLAERLYAESPSSNTLHVLAKAYHRSGTPRGARAKLARSAL